MTAVMFPPYSGTRCLMMPYIQGDPESLPDRYASYGDVVSTTYLDEGELGFLTIDESVAIEDTPHRGARAQHGRALHTEAGRHADSGIFMWGGGGWGGRSLVTLDRDVEILLANNLDGSCAIWDAEHLDTSVDGDIGDQAALYPYEDAIFTAEGEVRRIGILTPHESLPVRETVERQFLRIVGSGVHGREPYFTLNPKVAVA